MSAHIASRRGKVVVDPSKKPRSADQILLRGLATSAHQLEVIPNATLWLPPPPLRHRGSYGTIRSPSASASGASRSKVVVQVIASMVPIFGRPEEDCPHSPSDALVAKCAVKAALK